jgi:CBS domain-containing protein
MTSCSEIMRNEVQPVTPDQSVGAVARLMRDAQVGLVSVCDADGFVLGVVTDRDIAVRLCAEGGIGSSTPVGEIMTRDLVTCRSSDPLSRAEQLMIEHRKARIVVTDEEQRLVGVISLTDIAQCEEPLRAARILREISAREYRFRRSSVAPSSGKRRS